ncbi:recombinase family protein, partial [Evtepia sp.]|uniref:recombinase family protein n=1 Tax=Evtepia sp. TaxID=2773933 RepID=UPI002A8125F7
MYFEIENPGAYRAALYIRLSKEDENEGPSQSVTNQQSLLNEFVQQQGLSVYDTYVDDGWSGTSFDRPAFQRMIGDIEAGKVNLVITKDLSRLGRDYIMTGHYMERYFPEKGVRYISLLDGIDTGVESIANDITPFRAIMNDMYAKDISKKIRSVKGDKQRKGQFIGGKPVYGYKMHPTEKNKIVIDEGAAPTVRRIFALALEGMSCRQIAARLNAEGVPTPAAYAGLPVAHPGPYTGLWSSERISELLQNETYIGNMVQGRSVKISYKSKKCRKQPRENWVVVEGTHQPLVDKETFQQVG